MFEHIIDFVYPQYCSVCHRHGDYLCDRCRKNFKRNLPECYVCRRLSPSYLTHTSCKKISSLNRVFVAWEYNNVSSKILKLYKYRDVKDISHQLTHLLIEELLRCGFSRYFGDTLFIPVPISSKRKIERGFNQTDQIALGLARKFSQDVLLDLVMSKDVKNHRAGQNIAQRYLNNVNPFYVRNGLELSKYTSITIIDDVITTGITLENVATKLRQTYNAKLEINAICLFRGKPYYSDSTESLFNSSTIV